VRAAVGRPFRGNSVPANSDYLAAIQSCCEELRGNESITLDVFSFATLILSSDTIAMNLHAKAIRNYSKFLIPILLYDTVANCSKENMIGSSEISSPNPIRMGH